MRAEFIYALTHCVGGEKKYFYVGRSERDVGVRFAEHQRAAISGHTSVYKYIRDHVPCGIFEEEILCWVVDENPDDYEDFYVVKLIRAGHELQNEKHGDAKRLAATELALSDIKIDSVKDVREYKVRKKMESERLRAEIRGGSDRRNTSKPLAVLNIPPIPVKKKRVDINKELRERENAEWFRKQSHLFKELRVEVGDEEAIKILASQKKNK